MKDYSISNLRKMKKGELINLIREVVVKSNQEIGRRNKEILLLGEKLYRQRWRMEKKQNEVLER